MAYTSHVLVAFGGTWSDQTAEIWSCGVRLQSDGGGGVTLDTLNYMNDIKTPLSTWFALAASAMANDAQLKWLKVNTIGPDGKYLSTTNTNVTTYAGTAGGVSTSVPSFCSIAFTWETAKVRGPGHRGRIYPPNPCYSVVNGAKISAANTLAATTAGKALLTVLRNVGGVDGRRGTPVIASKIGGVIQPITGVSVDDIYDVQRRRKDRIVPIRSAVQAFP